MRQSDAEDGLYPLRLAAVAAIIIVLAFVLWPTPAQAQSPEPTLAPSTWPEYQQASEEYTAEAVALFEGLQASESREEATGYLGELLVLSIDHAAWSMNGIVWDDCYRDYADHETQRLLWYIALVSAQYHAYTALVGEPADISAVVPIYQFFASFAPPVTCEVT